MIKDLMPLCYEMTGSHTTFSWQSIVGYGACLFKIAHCNLWGLVIYSRKVKACSLIEKNKEFFNVKYCGVQSSCE